MMDDDARGAVFLGLREDADLEAFRAAAEDAERRAVPFDPRFAPGAAGRAASSLPDPGRDTARERRQGNVVLEISATPYLYTLRFYDWLRRNSTGELRPVHVDHAFANLDRSRRGDPRRGTDS